MLLCDPGALEAPDGPLTDPAAHVRACTQRACRPNSGRAMNRARARDGARLQSAHRSRQASARSRIALEQERGSDAYARAQNIFHREVSKPSVFAKQLEAVTDLT
jgi:hypothetical protein